MNSPHRTNDVKFFDYFLPMFLGVVAIFISGFFIPSMPALTFFSMMYTLSVSLPLAMKDNGFWITRGHSRYFLEILNYLGKWLSGISGTSLAASLAFGFSAYTSMQPNCTSTLFSYDALRGSIVLAKFFFFGSVLSLLISTLYYFVSLFFQIFLLLKGRPPSDDALDTLPSEILSLIVIMQFFLLMGAILFIVVGFTATYSILNDRSVGGGQLFWKEIERNCEAMERAP